MRVTNFNASSPLVPMETRIRIIFLISLVLSILFFTYFFKQSEDLSVEPILAPVTTGIRWQFTDLFWLPPGFNLTYLGTQESIGWDDFKGDVDIEVSVIGFVAALKRRFRLEDGFIGEIHLVEFISSNESLNFYLQIASSKNVSWDSDGLGLGKDTRRFSLIGKYVLITSRAPTEDILIRLHEQIASNLKQTRMGSPTLAKVEYVPAREFIFENRSFGPLPGFDLPDFGACFIISKVQFKKDIEPLVKLRPYNYGPLKGQRAYSRQSDGVLYLQDMGGFFLVTASLEKSLTRVQRGLLLKYFHIQK